MALYEANEQALGLLTRDIAKARRTAEASRARQVQATTVPLRTTAPLRQQQQQGLATRSYTHVALDNSLQLHMSATYGNAASEGHLLPSKL
jgi:hypothetical protein